MSAQAPATIPLLLQHLPDPRLRLIRRYGLYSSRSRGTWLRKPHLVRLAPEGWRQDHGAQCAFPIGPVDKGYTETSLTSRQSRASWARLIAKADPLALPALRFPYAHPGGDHRAPVGAQDPAPPGLDAASIY